MDETERRHYSCQGNVSNLSSKEPSMGVPITQYAFESISVDHFFLKGNEFLALVDTQRDDVMPFYKL